MLRIYKCRCKWYFVVGNKYVYGPIFEDHDASAAKIMPLKDFRTGYGDCYEGLVSADDAH